MGKQNLLEMVRAETSNEGCTSVASEDLESHSRDSLDKEAGSRSCRVCQCAESEKKGDIALGFLGITPPLTEAYKSNGEVRPDCKGARKDLSLKNNAGSKSELLDFISPDGEVFICNTDIEMGLCHQDALLELGCSCKNDLAMVHYACALKWFVNHGSTLCEICGCVAKNIRISDFNKVMGSLKAYEAVMERTASGESCTVQVHTSSCVGPDAVAAVQRQRLSEISLWFNPHNNISSVNNNNISTAVSQVVSELPSNTVSEDAVPATKWAVEATGFLLATGLLTLSLAWLIAPHVGKKPAKKGLHIILGGFCALTVVVFFRFFVLTRIKYGPARYWAILFVIWFLVFGIWASRTHGSHT
ncbi:RING/FYVE/PHD zinc finger superfamily protein [Quillaja saponaria]|uniref:RING/FYVE/PHD zinc finger superfamily protein n=1 Tax=Quillaja saponaria TaxID=32244 RepID=A0AAD7KU04_QUISA|nr:RING/FYVE/PHD zinc finger superfamily protein [Quillaja saponaria]